jgi:hypothetical protein
MIEVLFTIFKVGFIALIILVAVVWIVYEHKALWIQNLPKDGSK